MKVAIAGLGIAGAYLNRLLSGQGIKADCYEVKKQTRCGIHPCAWGTSKGFAELVEEAGLEPDDYILKRFGSINFDEVRVLADIMTFDKPRLISDLSESATVFYKPLNPGEYERIIDATGVSRAYLPRIESDLVIKCKQH